MTPAEEEYVRDVARRVCAGELVVVGRCFSHAECGLFYDAVRARRALVAAEQTFADFLAMIPATVREDPE